MIEEELMRLRSRLNDLQLRVIPLFENKTQQLFAQIMPLPKESGDRVKLEAEYDLQFKELRLRSDELIRIQHEIQNLEIQQKQRR